MTLLGLLSFCRADTARSALWAARCKRTPLSVYTRVPSDSIRLDGGGRISTPFCFLVDQIGMEVGGYTPADT